MTRSKPGMQNLGASCRSPLAFFSFRDWFRTLGSLVGGFPSCKVWTNRRVIKMTASVQHLYFGGKLPWRVSIYGIQTVSVSFFWVSRIHKNKNKSNAEQTALNKGFFWHAQSCLSLDKIKRKKQPVFVATFFFSSALAFIYIGSASGVFGGPSFLIFGAFSGRQELFGAVYRARRFTSLFDLFCLAFYSFEIIAPEQETVQLFASWGYGVDFDCFVLVLFLPLFSISIYNGPSFPCLLLPFSSSPFQYLIPPLYPPVWLVA